MKKKYLIIAITACSFFAGVSNSVQAQDTTLSFGKYLTQTQWLVTTGMDFVDNNQDNNPFKIHNRGGNSYGTRGRSGGSPAFNTPAKFAVEKDLYGFRHTKALKGISAIFAISSTSLRPHNFLSVDLYLKYDLNTLIGDTKFFDPYLMVGAGHTYMDYRDGNGPRPNGLTTGGRHGKDNFLNINAGLGFNLWIFPNVAINFQNVGKFHIPVKKWEGTNYFQNTIGLVFKIGRCTAIAPAVVEPACKRTKEAEDALIHLREHISK
jgi:OmpA-OmpF porin, OOP family